MKKNEKKIITIQGATASGKSKIALDLAEYFKTEIISADSRQIYKYLDIGTAKPNKSELQKVKHHLIDVISPNEQFSAGMFTEQADKIINQLSQRNEIPIVAGGTGFYIKSLLFGLFNAPDIPKELRENLRKKAEQNGADYVYQELKKIDPDTAEQISKNDVNKMLRALEIYLVSGKSIAEHWKEQNLVPKYKSLNIYLEIPREQLYGRINKRVDIMMKSGLEKENIELSKMGFKEKDFGMNSVGYKEFYPYFKGDITLDRCVELIKQHTRNYAKRQLTWYRRQEFDLTFSTNDIIIFEIIKTIENWMKC
ncbi:MAG: tRNA (adenosine(37)-N6)-dimethylallyltransferase MiaA [Candidatus Cloacimonetes bacterium]|nr:tRNA (adenosine(37)-N6)-dimethylallyltransferase MiaA [Candidatus Cloacimonadota bacterium]